MSTAPRFRRTRHCVYRLGAMFRIGGFCVLLTSGAQAQVRGASSDRTTPALAAEHWSVMAVKRAEALGLIDRQLPVQRSVPRHIVQERLQEAAERAGARSPHLSSLVTSWLARFAEEFPTARPAHARWESPSLGHRVSAGYLRHVGRVAPGMREFPWDRTGSVGLPAQTELQGDASLAFAPSAKMAVLVEPQLTADRVAWRGWDVILSNRGVFLSVGRQPIGYGYGELGGVVLSGTEPLGRVEVGTVDAVGLPNFLRVLGPISLHGFGSRLREPRHPGNPLLWGMGVAARPHSRLTLSVHRASIVGGDSVDTPVTLRNFVRTFVGHNLLGFENEVVAAQARVRLPTERLLPITLYGEWGAEDAAGAWRDVPGRLYGAYVPAIPGWPGAALGIEHVSFAASCCGNPPWYRHSTHTGGWVKENEPLGHRLGGQGNQTVVYSHLDIWDARVRMAAHLFSGQRDGENLFVPGREGRSRGGRFRAAVRLSNRSDAAIMLFREAGREWSEQSGYVGLSAYF